MVASAGFDDATPLPLFEDVWERVRKATELRTQADMATFLNIKSPSITGAKQRGHFPLDWAYRISAKYGLGLDYLLHGKGEIPSGRHSVALTRDEAPPYGRSDELRAHPVADGSDSYDVPLVSEYPSAGTGADILDDLEPRCHYAFPAKWLRKKGNPKDMLLLEVNGHSMEPEIKHGDLVMLDRGKTRPMTGRFFVVRLEGSLYVKRVEVLPRKLRFVSLDSSYTPIEVDMTQDYTDLVQIIGQVLWLGREMR